MYGSGDDGAAPGDLFPNKCIRAVWMGMRPAPGLSLPAGASPARILLVRPLDRHDLLDLDDALLMLDDIKNGEGSADMEAIDCRGMGILKFLFVPSRKRVLREFLDLFDDDAPGFWGEPL